MNQTGHYGINLSIGSCWLLGLTALGYPLAGFLIFIATAAIATFPDIDHHAYNVPLIKHRGWTHTIYFAIGLGTAVAIGGVIGGQFLADRAPTAAPSVFPPNYFAALIFAFSAGITLGILGHIAGDMLTPVGIAPFNPVLPRLSVSSLPTTSWTLDLTTAANPTANVLFGFMGIGMTALSLYLTAPKIAALF